ncbi:MAG: PEP-CTERM sorting domain-containing protein [Phycisphaerae bacterium]
MSTQLKMGRTWWPTLLFSALLLAIASPASAAIVLADSDDPLQTDLPDIDAVGPFADNGYDGSLGSMEQFTLDVSSEYDEILGVEMSLWLVHGAVGEVFVKLESPEGTRITIFNRPGSGEPAGDEPNVTGNNAQFGPADNPVELIFYDGATVQAEKIGMGLSSDEIVGVDGSPAVTDYAPDANGSVDDGGFAAFIGENPNGTWKLYVADSAVTLMGGMENGQGGELHRWQLRMTAIPEPSTLVLMSLAAAALAARKRSRRDLPTG